MCFLISLAMLTGCSNLFDNDPPLLYCYNTEDNSTTLIHTQTKESAYSTGFDNILWSPNSKYIAYTDLYKEDIDEETYINTPTGSDLITLPYDSYDDNIFGWSEDSTKFFYVESGVTMSYTLKDKTTTTSNINISQLKSNSNNSSVFSHLYGEDEKSKIYSPNGVYYLYSTQ